MNRKIPEHELRIHAPGKNIGSAAFKKMSNIEPQDIISEFNIPCSTFCGSFCKKQKIRLMAQGDNI
ncbi:MAG: hypothetical protein DRH32_07555 [Deltaproteobacteria bacterium]|nr:MAG: hypothetical protein DRH32_07555 [Deltaproteobacteria bacterium]